MARIRSAQRQPKRHAQQSQQASASSQVSESSEGEVTEETSQLRRKSLKGFQAGQQKMKTTSRGRAAGSWLSMLGTLMFGMWLLYRYQTEVLPSPLSEKVAGTRGFSEERAYRHVKELASLGPHPVHSEALDRAIQYVRDQLTEIQETANLQVEVEVDYFHARPGVNRLKGGLFKGKSLVYSGLKHVVVRLSPKYDDNALDNAILVSSHIDTVITAEGAGDCSSCLAIMLELVRALSYWAQGFRHSVIFLFNTGEEEGLVGAHSFMTQHPWRNTIRAAIDLEAMGVGGKHYLFQGGPDKWLVDVFAKVAKQPATMMLAQDIFHSGLVKSATDFQIFREVAGLTGLDFAFMDNSAVYHTKNDKLTLLRPGSLQHSGDNMLPFLREVATSPEFAVHNFSSSTEFSKMDVVYWDVLGLYMVTYSWDFAKLLHHSIMYQVVVLQVSSVVLSGTSSVIATCLAFLAIYLTWCFAIGFTLLVAIIVPTIGNTAVPFIACPWLVIPLYCAPAIVGAVVGHYFGHMLLVTYLWHVDEEKKNAERRLGKSDQGASQKELTKHAPRIVLWEAERWLFKAGIMQWVLVLGLSTWLKAGSSYLALAWVVGPTVAYGIFELQLSPLQSLRQLRYSTFWLGVIAPTILTALPAFHFPRVFIGMLVSFDRNPGALPEWMGSVMLACILATFTTLILVYLLPYAHRSEGLAYILGALGVVFLLSLASVALNVFPAFTSDVGRGINVVHVINADGQEGDASVPKSFLLLSSGTMGNLNQEAKLVGDVDLVCGRNSSLDLVTYQVKYGCRKPVLLDENLWEDRPFLAVIKDEEGSPRATKVHLNAGKSHRWFLGISSSKITSYELEAVTDSNHLPEVLVPSTEAVGVGDWHHIQYVNADANGPSNFVLTLYWSPNATTDLDSPKVLKLRTDIDSLTTEAETMLKSLPKWCVSFGKSTSPYPLAYLATLAMRSSKEFRTDEG